MKFLHSNIFETGTRFIISDKIKNPSHLSGSIGFVSYLSGLDDSYQNVANISTIITRKGKTGKERLFFCKLKIPIFAFENEQFLKILPTVESRRNFVFIEKDGENNQTLNLMDVAPLYFIGWATAMANKLKLMSSLCKHSKWPGGNKTPVNKILRLPDYFGEDTLSHLDTYGSLEFREAFLNETRNMYSSMVKIHLERSKIKADCELNASEFLEFTNKGKFLEKKNAKNEYEFTDDNALLERTIEYYKAAKKDLGKPFTSKK
jgi:hypothetical protein